MTSTPVLTILALLGLGQTALCVWLALRVRDLSPRGVVPPDDRGGSTDQINDLQRRVKQLEDRVKAVETSASRGEPAPSKRHRRLDRRQEASADGPVLIAVPSLASVPVGTSSAVVAEFDRRFGPIWALADSGAHPDEIARRTGHPIGQVELILGLRGTRPGVAAGPSSPSNRDDADA